MPTKQNRPGKDIVKLLKKGLLPKQIKNKLGVTNCAITYWAKQLGLPLFRRGRPFLGAGKHDRTFKSDVRQLTKKMRLSGNTFAAIGKELGVTRQRAHQYFLTADS